MILYKKDCYLYELPSVPCPMTVYVERAKTQRKSFVCYLRAVLLLIRSCNMSLSKIFDSFAKQFLKITPYKSFTKQTIWRSLPNSRAFSRPFGTQTALDLDNKILNSPWGEIKVGNETLTEYVFSDYELWDDKPSVVSLFFLRYF